MTWFMAWAAISLGGGQDVQMSVETAFVSADGTCESSCDENGKSCAKECASLPKNRKGDCVDFCKRKQTSCTEACGGATE